MQNELSKIKENVINTIVVFSALFLLILFPFSIIRWFEFGWDTIYIFHSILYFFALGLAIFRKKLNYLFKTIAISAIYLLISLVGLLKFGLYGGYIFAIIALAIIGTLIRLKYAIIISLIVFLLFSLVAIGYITHSLEPVVDLNLLVRSYSHWLLTICSIFAISFIYIYGFGNFYRNLSKTITEKEFTAKQLLVQNELLETNEHKYRIFFETSFDAILLTCDDGKIFSANPAACEMFQLTEKEIILLGRRGLTDNNDDRLSKFLNLRKETGKARGEITMFRKNSIPFEAEVSSAIYKITDDKIFASIIIRDITERKKSESALLESEKILSVIFNNHSDMQLLASIDDMGDFRVDAINNPYKKTAESLGIFLSNDEIIGNTIRTLNDALGLSDAYYDLTIAKYIEVAKTGIAMMYLDSLDISGQIFTLEITLSPIMNESGKCQYILYNSHNITAQKMADIALIESEEKFKQIFLTSPDFVTISNIEDKKYIDVNENFLEKSGYTREEVIGKTSIEINIWNNIEDRIRMLSTLNQNGYVENMEAKFRLKNGNVINGLLSARLFKINNEQHILTITRDITKLKLVEKQNLETQLKFKTAMNSMTDAVVITDIDGNFIDFNDAFVKFHRFKNREVCAKTFDEYPGLLKVLYLNGEKAPIEMWPIPRALRGEIVTNDEFSICRTDTGETWIGSYSSSPIRDVNNNIVGSVVVGRDITDKKEAEQAFKETASNLRSILDNREDLIWSIDCDYNYIIFNNAYKNIINSEYNVVLKKGMSSTANFTEEEANYWIPLFESVFEGESVTFEHQYIFNNAVCHFQTSLHPIIEDNIVTGASGLSVNITERKLVEEALKLSEEKFEKAFRLSPFLITLSTLGGLVIDVNERIYSTLGYTKDEFINRHSNNNPLWVDPEVREQFITTLKNGEYVNGNEVSFYKKNGEIGIFSWSGCLIDLNGVQTCLSIVYDITQRKLVQEALKVSEEKFEKSFRLSPFLITLSTSEGQIIDVNDRIHSTLGYTRDEFLTFNAIEQPLWVNLEERDNLIELLKTNEALSDKEVHLLKKNGEIGVFSLSASSIEIDGREMYLGIVYDITERKNAEQEIIKLNAELEMKVKKRTIQLEAINKELETFSYSVSHDLKAPLRGIDGYSKLLFDHHKKNLAEEGQLFIEKIRSSTLQMNRIIDDLLDYSRLERSQLQIGKIKIKDFVESVLSIYSVELKAGYFKLDTKIEDIEIVADSKGLSIAFRNLIENAIKFSKEKTNPTIKIEFEETDSSWIISVNDNGIGFDMQYHHKIFNIFQRLQRAEDFPGTGIGLALVSKAMQRMHGKTWAESIPNVGSTFYLEIPKTQ